MSIVRMIFRVISPINAGSSQRGELLPILKVRYMFERSPSLYWSVASRDWMSVHGPAYQAKPLLQKILELFLINALRYQPSQMALLVKYLQYLDEHPSLRYGLYNQLRLMAHASPHKTHQWQLRDELFDGPTAQVPRPSPWQSQFELQLNDGVVRVLDEELKNQEVVDYSHIRTLTPTLKLIRV